MRIREIILENSNTVKPGWQTSEIIPLPLNKGYLKLSYRFNQQLKVDEILFVYHNKNLIGLDRDNEFGWVVSVKVKDGQVIKYDYFDYPNGKHVGPFTTIEALKILFDSLVKTYLI